MIGKSYAQIAGYSDTEAVTNKELVESLGLPEGTIRNSLKALRDDRLIIAERTGVHHILHNQVGAVVDSIFKKIQT